MLRLLPLGKLLKTGKKKRLMKDTTLTSRMLLCLLVPSYPKSSTPNQWTSEEQGAKEDQRSNKLEEALLSQSQLGVCL